MKLQKIGRFGLSLAAFLVLAPFSEAGKIGPLVDQASPAHSSGYGGWNLNNVDVKMTDTDFVLDVTKTIFDKSNGSYATMVLGDSFESDIHDSLDTSGPVLVNLHGKNWPVGEPAGVKVIEANNHNDTISHSRPASCIMTTSFLEGGYLDAAVPTETLCNSAFQTHKRFKFNMLPTMVGADGAYGTGVNLNFNVYADANTWRYSILQKINNYTGKRLSGFKTEVGFLDAGGVFTTASANGADIRLSIGTLEDTDKDGNPVDIWDANELATFSHGLFGPQTFEEPVPHFPQDGFFDNKSAGYNVSLNASKDTIESGATLGSNYAALPVPGGAIANQFGDWLPSTWIPSGIFWDDDNNPATDAQLMAFWGEYNGGGTFGWMKSDRENFVPATAAELTAWASGAVFSVGGIEDVLNLGLNYIVEIGDVSTFPAAANGTFTIRITPKAAATQVAPGYTGVGNTPPPLGTYVSHAGLVFISPEPTFAVGNVLTVSVADKGLDLDPNALDTVDVTVTTSLGETELMTLTEIETDRAVFVGTISTGSTSIPGSDNDGVVRADSGTVVTATYYDADTTGVGGPDATVTATTSVTAGEKHDRLFAVNDTASLLFTIFGFLVIGGAIARRKLA